MSHPLIVASHKILNTEHEVAYAGCRVDKGAVAPCIDILAVDCLRTASITGTAAATTYSLNVTIAYQLHDDVGKVFGLFVAYGMEA